MGTRAATLTAALLLAACAAPHDASGEDPARDARPADDAALEAAAAELAPFEDHFVAFSGGRFLGGAMLLEDAAALIAANGAEPSHAYLFVLGSEGDRRVPLPARYGPRVAGNGLLQALGLAFTFDPEAGTLTLSKDGEVRTFQTGSGAAAATFTVEPASGLGTPVPLEFVVSSAFAGTAIVAREDAVAAGLARSEIPGTVQLAESLTGRTTPCRRALARVTLAGFDDRPDVRVSAIVEVLFPR
jgi:hypothetical protein